MPEPTSPEQMQSSEAPTLQTLIHEAEEMISSSANYSQKEIGRYVQDHQDEQKAAAIAELNSHVQAHIAVGRYRAVAQCYALLQALGERPPVEQQLIDYSTAATIAAQQQKEAVETEVKLTSRMSGRQVINSSSFYGIGLELNYALQAQTLLSRIQRARQRPATP